MSKEAAPAFQFFVNDYLTSERVRAMSNDARGVYVDMLAFAWKEVGLPSNLAVMARVIGQPESTLRRLWPQIRGAWKKSAGRYYNERQERQRLDMHAHREQQSDRGRKGAHARWHKHSASITPSNAWAMPTDGSSSSSASSVQEPPNPPTGVGGLRILSRDWTHADRTLKSWTGGCLHQPQCINRDSCRQRIAREHAQKRKAS